MNNVPKVQGPKPKAGKQGYGFLDSGHWILDFMESV